MRYGLLVVVTALVVAGCAGPSAAGTTVAGAAASSPSANGPEIQRPQPFNLFTHCGILTTYFAGRTFYLAELYPSRVRITVNAGRPEVAGTMTLLSPHVAAFVDPAGNRILFVDKLPGATDTPYPFAVHVMSDGKILSDEQFAGRRWHTAETLPGVISPPYGNGLDRSTLVAGTLTLIDAQDATFHSQAGAILHFTALPPIGCD
jgi:hypothetical protein